MLQRVATAGSIGHWTGNPEGLVPGEKTELVEGSATVLRYYSGLAIEPTKILCLRIFSFDYLLNRRQTHCPNRYVLNQEL